MEKYYYDAKKNLEVVDVSGKKSIKKLNAQYKANLVDITQQRLDKIEKEKGTQETEAKKEALIQAKMRELAIAELKKEGKLL